MKYILSNNKLENKVYLTMLNPTQDVIRLFIELKSNVYLKKIEDIINEILHQKRKIYQEKEDYTELEIDLLNTYVAVNFPNLSDSIIVDTKEMFELIKKYNERTEEMKDYYDDNEMNNNKSSNDKEATEETRNFKR